MITNEEIKSIETNNIETGEDTIKKQLANILMRKRNVLESRLKENKIDRSFEDYMNDIMYCVMKTKGEKKEGDLTECDFYSIVDSALQLAKCGLSVGGNVGHLVKFGKKCNFMIGYQGYEILLHRSVGIKQKIVDVVYENDEFEMEDSTQTFDYNTGIICRAGKLNHIKRENISKKILKAYCIIMVRDGNSFGICLDVKDIKEKYFREWDKTKSIFIEKSNPFHKYYPEQMLSKQIFIILARQILKFYASSLSDGVITVLGEEENEQMKISESQINKSSIKKDMFILDIQKDIDEKEKNDDVDIAKTTEDQPPLI